MASAVERARGLWGTLASAGESFPVRGVRVVVAPGSGLCPAGWVGAVTLGEGALVTVPEAGAVDVVRRALGEGPVLAGIEALRSGGVLGPAALAYLDGDAFVPARGAVERLDGGHPEVRALVEAVGPDEAGEAAVDEVTSPVFAVRDGGPGGRVVAVAGYEAWPASTAHLCVLTHPGFRGRGLARQVASGAVAHALDAGLLPQWRAVPPASRRVALALGFRELGRQLSVRLV